MFKGNFKEASSQAAEFPEDEPVSFDVLLGWAYFGTIPSIVHDSKRRKLRHTSWPATGLYALAEKLCLPDLQNKIMDEIMNYYYKSNTLPSTKTICKMYEMSPEKSPLRKFAALAFHYVARTESASATYHKVWSSSQLHDAIMQLPDLSLDFLELVRCDTELKSPYKLDFCTFHVHSDGKSCFSGKSSSSSNMI